MLRVLHCIYDDPANPWVAGGGEVKLAASAEFVNSASALPAFQAAYGFELKPDQLIVLSGGDTAATIAATLICCEEWPSAHQIMR